MAGTYAFRGESNRGGVHFATGATVAVHRLTPEQHSRRQSFFAHYNALRAELTALRRRIDDYQRRSHWARQRPGRPMPPPFTHDGGYGLAARVVEAVYNADRRGLLNATNGEARRLLSYARPYGITDAGWRAVYNQQLVVLGRRGAALAVTRRLPSDVVRHQILPRLRRAYTGPNAVQD